MNPTENSKTPPPNSASDDQTSTRERLFQSYQAFFRDIIDLRKGVDKRATIEEIKNKKSMSGANAWMLMCSIMIASLGLNLDSQAVIIGAMLISPLMSPILGIGLAIGINDQVTLKKALMHFGVAILISVVTSTIYFFLSPLSEVTEQITQRTKPTFLDVLIAFFGGLAGIISVARKDISTTLPGVAIATALMPPLCVTGYGIATGEWATALSAFYLFFLNSFFVASATYIIVRYLRFPYKVYVKKKERRRNLLYTGLFSLITVIPSFFIFRDVLHEVQTRLKVKRFVEKYIGDDRILLDDYKLYDQDSVNTLILKVYGDEINDTRLPEFEKGLLDVGLKKTRIQIIPSSEVPLERFTQLETNVSSGVEKLAKEVEVIQRENKERNETVDRLRTTLETLRMDSSTFAQVCLEIKALFPDIESVYYANAQHSDLDGNQDQIPILVLDWNRSKALRHRREENERIAQFVRSRIGIDTVKIITE